MNTQEAVISLLLAFPERADQVSDLVQPHWFEGEYRKAFDLLITGDNDAVTLTTAGIASNTVAHWLDVECGWWSLKKHAHNLQQQYIAHSLRQLSRQITRAENNDDALELINRFQNNLIANDRHELVSTMEGARRLAKELERRSTHTGLLGMTYGLTDLDAKTEGMHRGDLVVVAAPSSMGKTAFASGIVESAAEQGHRALIFSCEMTVEQLLMRTLAAKSGVPLSRIRSAKFAPQDWNRMTGAFEKISSQPIWLDDSPGITVQEIERKTKKANRQHGIDVVLIDYLQILAYDKSAETRELDRITTSLKNLAKDQNVCIILLSQLNRSGQQSSRPPQMTDLRGSGMIENNSDVILFPWRPAANCELCLNNQRTADHDPEIHRREAYVLIGKQRQGERNISIPVLWREEITRFENLEAL